MLQTVKIKPASYDRYVNDLPAHLVHLDPLWIRTSTEQLIFIKHCNEQHQNIRFTWNAHYAQELWTLCTWWLAWQRETKHSMGLIRSCQAVEWTWIIRQLSQSTSKSKSPQSNSKERNDYSRKLKWPREAMKKPRHWSATMNIQKKW